ncbi:hypothetical protein [Companilactobacillus nuruki]|uniref:Uncharacterized protein n=1 Tax=Companilactobacillus nuruki TaxID=1993540 RepID=A0A2N7AVP1_9LACO|nr:hypothetical protein [Companilactobacillus nuruki]PMD72242.1 hypothetical protein CBP76_03650 [Companilactobacillus nuruki]
MIKRIITWLLILISLLPTTLISPTRVQANTENRYTKHYNELKKINQTISQKLYDKQMTSKTEKWAKSIKGIKYLQNNQIEVYVTSKFKKLKLNNRQDIIDQVQLFSLRTIDHFKEFDSSTYLDGLSTIIFCDGSYIGKSKFLNNKDFTWNQ